LDVRLKVPLSIPVLGEAFVKANNPVMFSTLDLFLESSVSIEPSNALELSLHSRRLEHSVVQLFGNTVQGKFSVTAPSFNENEDESDLLKLASFFYVVGMEKLEPVIPSLMGRVDEKNFITLSRALTSLCGGFVVCRRGEGLLPLDGGIDAAVILKLKGGDRRLSGRLSLFSKSFAELVEPLWHALGHLVIEGGRAVRLRDAPLMGKLLTLESSLAYSMGVLDLGDLRKLSRFHGSLGWKAICSRAVGGELILAPKETPKPPSCDWHNFTLEGIREVGSC